MRCSLHGEGPAAEHAARRQARPAPAYAASAAWRARQAAQIRPHSTAVTARRPAAVLEPVEPRAQPRQRTGGRMIAYRPLLDSGHGRGIRPRGRHR